VIYFFIFEHAYPLERFARAAALEGTVSNCGVVFKRFLGKTFFFHQATFRPQIHNVSTVISR